jgi:integrase
VETDDPEAYSPQDAAKIMQTALDSMPELVPVLALGMFCGLRVSEAKEVDLRKLTGNTREFRTPRNRKTGPRMAPLTDAASAWLAAQGSRTGKGWTRSERQWDYAIEDLFRLAGVEKINNGVRHSFISYRTAETRDVARVADECGNSVATIKKYYRQIVTSEEAERFFAIRPDLKADNVTAISEGRKGA